MGAWGPAIFSDDVACDIRDEYLHFVGEGHSGPEATKIVLENSKEFLNDADDGPVVWLALAATQWKCGRLEDYIKNKALEIIKNGQGLDIWRNEGASALKKRQAALLKLQAQLESQ